MERWVVEEVSTMGGEARGYRVVTAKRRKVICEGIRSLKTARLIAATPVLQEILRRGREGSVN